MIPSLMLPVSASGSTCLPLCHSNCLFVERYGRPSPVEVGHELTITQVVEQFFFSHEGFSYQRHLIFTTVILFSSMFGKSDIRSLPQPWSQFFLVSLVTCDLGVMLEITGGISATALAYIFPAVCYLRLASPEKPWYSRSKLPASVCAGFGLLVMCLSLFLALGKVWRPEGDPKICM